MSSNDSAKTDRTCHAGRGVIKNNLLMAELMCAVPHDGTPPSCQSPLSVAATVVGVVVPAAALWFDICCAHDLLQPPVYQPLMSQVATVLPFKVVG
jgi:hypothetical protein